MKSALMVWGGWEGHEPKACTEIFARFLKGQGYEVEISDTLDAFNDLENLKKLDLIVPCWTGGLLTPEQEAALTGAVAEGVGIGGWHGGMGDAFRNNCAYLFMTGGLWIAHPDNLTEYMVNITNHEDPITHGMADFKMASEQYYMLVDPSNEVLAATTFHPKSAPWVDGCVMPVVWKRVWGERASFLFFARPCGHGF